MKLPFGACAVIDLDGRRWALRASELSPLSKGDSLTGPRVLFTDFDGALQGVEQVATARRYTAAVIEKNLRDRGESEGSSKVLLHQAQSKSGTTRALYTAVPSDLYEEYMQQAGDAGDHYLVVPHLALLLKRARKIKDETVYILFQHGLNLDLLLLVGQRPQACLRVTASGSDWSDWERALRFLTGEMDVLQSRLDHAGGSALWVDWDPDEQADASAICEWLAHKSGLQIEREATRELVLGERKVNASLPALFELDAGPMAVNPLPALALYWSERILPAATLAVAGLSLALAVAGWQWHGQADDYAVARASLGDASAGPDLAAISAELQQAPSPRQRGATLDFVAQLYQAASRPSLAMVIADIRSVLPLNCNLTGLALDTAQGSPRLIMEGWIDAEPTTINHTIEGLIRDLSQLGYPVQDNGLLALKQREMFQLELTLEDLFSEV